MSNPGHSRPGTLRPGYTRLPDGRGRMVVFAEKLSSGEQFRAALLLAKGTLYGIAEGVDTSLGRLAHLAALRLVDDGTQQLEAGWFFVRTYEELHETAETQVGKDRRSVDESGRVTLIRNWVQFATNALALGTVGTDNAGGADTGLVLAEAAEVRSFGTVREIERRYVSAGILASSTELSNNGKLEVRSITAFNEVPTTPAGFVLVGSAAQNPGGMPTRVYRFAKGEGTLSDSTRALADGLRERSVVVLAAPSTTYTYADLPGMPTGVPTAFAVVELDGHRRYSASAIQTLAGGALTGYTYSFTTRRPWRAPGRIKAQLIEKTVATPGAIPTSVNFKQLTIYVAPPVDYPDLTATVTVGYQATSDIGTVTPAYFRPARWAVVDFDLILRGPVPLRSIQERPGFCVVADTPGTGVSTRTLTTPGTAPVYDIGGEGGGNLLFGSNVNTVTVRGPELPIGTFTLDADLRPAGFEGLDGTRWYRSEQVVVTAPTLPALPDLEA